MSSSRPLANPFTRLLAALGILFAVPEVLMIGLSLAKIVIASWMAAASLGAGAALALITWLRLRPTQPKTGQPAKTWHKWLFYSLGGLLGLAYLALWYVAYLSPEITCDGTAYHIPVISMWANQGYIYWIDPYFQLETLVNGYPKSVELAAFVLIRATGLSDLSNTLNLLFLPFGILGLASLTRSLGASKPVALLTGFLWVIIPVNLFQSTTAYIDSAYASLAIAFLALLVAVQQYLRSQNAIPWRLVPAFGAAAGLTLAAKGSAGLMVAAGFAGLLTASLVNRLAAWRTSRGLLWRALAVAACAGVIALAVGGFWYARNYVITGTPIYPVGVKLGDKVIFPGSTVSDALWETGNTPEFMKPWGFKERIAYSWTQTLIHKQEGVPPWPWSMMGVDSRIGGLGFLWLGACVPALLYALVSSLVVARRKPERLALWLVTAVVLAAFLGSPMNWWARYTVWIYAAGLPAFGLLISDLLAVRRWWLAPVALWAVASLGWGFYEGSVAFARTLHDAYPGNWPPRTIQAWLPDAWHWRDGYLFPETRGTALDKVMASDGPIAVGSLWGNAPGGRLQHNIYGQLSLPIGQRKLMFLPDNMTVTLRKTLNEVKPVYIIWDGNRDLPVWVRNMADKVERAPGFWVVTLKPIG
ncbi:MAG: hypothetical protein ACYC6L_11250 [Anaerolineae bacterium]